MQFGAPPLIEPSDSETVFTPPDRGEGYWIGAPCVHTYDGVTYVAVRERTPEERGRSLMIYERRARAEYEPVTEITSSALSVESIERSALVTDMETGELKLYLSVDHGQNDWTIQKLDDVPGPDELDPATARDVLTPHPGKTDEQTVKDPHLITIGGRYVMFYAGHDGRCEQAHMATSHDGETWTRVPNNPVLPSEFWHDYHTRISCVVPASNAPFWLVFYDGSGAADYHRDWNLRTGVAIAHDLTDITDTSPAGPRYTAGRSDRNDATTGFAAFRYLDILQDGGESVLFYEAATDDGSFELREAAVETDGH